MKPPPNQPPPPKRFPWFRTSLVLGGLTAGVIIFSRYHTELPWCARVDQMSRPAIEKTCDTSSQAWDWVHGKWTNIGRGAGPGGPGGTGASGTGDSGSTNDASTGTAPLTPAADGGLADPALPSMSVYFTPTETGSRAAVSRMLCALIRSADHSVIVSYTDFDDADVAQALIAAHKSKGVTVQVGVDNRNCMRPAVQDLIRAGVPVSTDRSGKAVNANFLIIDSQVVCYGSVMPTFKSLYRDNNCLFSIADRKLSARFISYFQDLYPGARNLVGSGTPAKDATGAASATSESIDALLVLGGLQASLGSDGALLNRVVEQIAAAETAIQLLTPTLNNDAVNEALTKAARRGVKVEICVDRAATISSEQQLILQNARITLARTAAAGTLGESVMVLDHRTVVEGHGLGVSLGLTERRGIGLIMHSAGMAGIFEGEFDRISRNRPAAPDGYAFELLRGHSVTPLMIATPAAPAALAAPAAQPAAPTAPAAPASQLSPDSQGTPAPKSASGSQAATAPVKAPAAKPHHARHHHATKHPTSIRPK